MGGFKAHHSVRTASFEVALPPERAFGLFEPEGERAWAAGWAPRYLHPEDGRAASGMVFTTGHGGEETIWTLLRHEPENGWVEYQRVTPGSRTGSVRVQCAAEGAGRTRVTVTYALTALTPAGNEHVRAFDAGYEAFIASWAASIRETTATMPAARSARSPSTS